MIRRLRHTPDRVEQVFSAYAFRSLHAFPFYQLRESRPAGHGGNTAFGTKSNLNNLVRFRLRTQFEDIAAGWIFQTHRCVRFFDYTWIAGIFKVVEQFPGVHIGILMLSPHLVLRDADFAQFLSYNG